MRFAVFSRAFSKGQPFRTKAGKRSVMRFRIGDNLRMDTDALIASVVQRPRRKQMIPPMGHRLQPRAGAVCGQQFAPTNGTQVYCGTVFRRLIADNHNSARDN